MRPSWTASRELRVPDDEAGRRVQPRKRPIDERGEGVMIALPRAFDERSLVHDSLSLRPAARAGFERVWRQLSWKGSAVPARHSQRK